LANRDLILKNEEKVSKVLELYMKTVKHHNGSDKFEPSANIFVDLERNCQFWFGCLKEVDSEFIIVDFLDYTKSKMMNIDKKKVSFPNKTAYSVIRSSFLKELGKKKSMVSNITKNEDGKIKDTVLFKPKSLEDWEDMKEITNFNDTPILFFKNAEIRDVSRNNLGIIINKIKEYPEAYIKLIGHTGNLGSNERNNKLSLERAEWVKSYLVKMYGIKEDRILSVGYGNDFPLERIRGEGELSLTYQYRLNRVEIYLGI